MASAGNKTIVACRPGMLQAMQSAFAGMEVVVDDKLTTDYEFRERELTGMEAIEAEVEAEERFEADPKRALNAVVPLVQSQEEYGKTHFTCGFLLVRVDPSTSNGSQYALITDLSDVKPVIDGNTYEVNIAATIGAVSSHLKSKGWKVFSVSEAESISFLKA